MYVYCKYMYISGEGRGGGSVGPRGSREYPSSIRRMRADSQRWKGECFRSPLCFTRWITYTTLQTPPERRWRVEVEYI